MRRSTVKVDPDWNIFENMQDAFTASIEELKMPRKASGPLDDPIMSIA